MLTTNSKTYSYRQSWDFIAQNQNVFQILTTPSPLPDVSPTVLAIEHLMEKGFKSIEASGIVKQCINKMGGEQC